MQERLARRQSLFHAKDPRLSGQPSAGRHVYHLHVPVRR
jgi:hypothetical protein